MMRTKTMATMKFWRRKSSPLTRIRVVPITNRTITTITTTETTIIREREKGSPSTTGKREERTRPRKVLQSGSEVSVGYFGY